MIKLEVIDEKRHHFLVRADEPVRIEVLNSVAFVYLGFEDDPEQEPVGCYDGLEGRNTNWTTDDGCPSH